MNFTSTKSSTIFMAKLPFYYYLYKKDVLYLKTMRQGMFGLVAGR